MALTLYQTRTKQLLQNPSTAATQLYSDSDLTGWINEGRGQLAGEAECVRVMGTLTTTVDQRNYAFSSIDLGTSSITGVDGALNVRQISYAVGEGQQFVYARNWEWFALYNLNNPVPQSGPPREWSQYKQGATATSNTPGNWSGSFYLDPSPDIGYTLTLDCVCFPIPLTTDSTIEVIPYLWTDAIPYYAAWKALLSSQTSARTQDAERMFNYYNLYVERARKAANPSVNRWLYQQSPDPTQIAKLGLQQKMGAQ